MPKKIKILLFLSGVLSLLVAPPAFWYWMFSADFGETLFDNNLTVVLLCVWILFPLIMAVIFQIKPLKADSSYPGNQDIRNISLKLSSPDLFATLAVVALYFALATYTWPNLLLLLVFWLASFIGFQILYFLTSDQLYRATADKTGFVNFYIISGYTHMMINFFIMLAIIFAVSILEISMSA